MKLFFAIALLFSANLYAAAGFEKGNTIDIQPYQGVAHYSCLEGRLTQYRSVTCYTDDIHPGSKDYFVNSSGIRATKVRFKNVKESGRMVSKTQKYIANTGKTTRRVNLLINTLTQRPLLGAGKNQITYTMLNRGKEVETGSFEVNVNVQPVNVCSDMNLNFNYDCVNTNQVCDDYFYFHRSCGK